MPLPLLALLPFAGKLLNKIFPDPEKKAEAEKLMMEAQARGDLDSLNAELQVMLAEAKSQDKWTSRARPSFLYVIYLMILASIPMGILYAFNPLLAANVILGVQNWLGAIPSALWSLFGAGYLGYVGSRSFDKKKLMDGISQLGK